MPHVIERDGTSLSGVETTHVKGVGTDGAKHKHTLQTVGETSCYFCEMFRTFIAVFMPKTDDTTGRQNDN